MKRSFMILAALLLLLLPSMQGLHAQDDNKSKLDFGTDMVSRYVWRGTDFGNSPSIQPFISYSIAGFEIGTWGSFSTNAANMQEVDLYASYTFAKDMFTVGLTDYFFPDATVSMNNYFDYGDTTTGHIFEGNLGFNGTGNVPLYFTANYNFYGADKDNSLYFEIGYKGSCKYVDYTVFMGGATGKGIYLTPGADGFSVVNVGLGVSKDIQITEKWSLPLFAQIITNPQAQNIFLVFGFSL